VLQIFLECGAIILSNLRIYSESTDLQKNCIHPELHTCSASVLFSNSIYIYVLLCRYIVHGFAFLYNYYNTQTHNTRVLAPPNHLPGRSVSSKTCLDIKIVVQLYILYIICPYVLCIPALYNISPEFRFQLETCCAGI